MTGLFDILLKEGTLMDHCVECVDAGKDGRGGWFLTLEHTVELSLTQ